MFACCVCSTTTGAEDSEQVKVSQEPGGERIRFVVELQKRHDADAIGLQLDVQHTSAFEIIGVKEVGLVHQYNLKAPDDRKVKVGNFITSVNDRHDDPKAMLKEMTDGDRKVRLEVAQHVELQACVPKISGAVLGLVLHFEDRDKNIFSQAHLDAMKKGLKEEEAKREAQKAVDQDQTHSALVVLEVQEGCIKQYNESVESSRQVLPGDRIKKVNMAGGKPRDMLKQMQDETHKLVLTISRPVDPAS